VIKEKELQELRPQVRYNGQDITLQSIQGRLDTTAQRCGIPIAFRFDQIRSGIVGGAEDCLVIYHPDHLKDYFHVAVRIKRQGTFASISIDTFGTSKLMKAEAMRKQILSTAKVGWDRAGDTHKDYNVLNDAVSGAAFTGAAFVGIRHLIKGKSDKEKMEYEQQWYTAVCDMLNEIISK